MELNPDALQIATTLDTERQAGRVRGPLHGIPFLVSLELRASFSPISEVGNLAPEGIITD